VIYYAGSQDLNELIEDYTMGTTERSAIFAYKPNKGIYKATKALREKYIPRKNQDPDNVDILRVTMEKTAIQHIIGM
jgi:hypothetical protein